VDADNPYGRFWARASIGLPLTAFDNLFRYESELEELHSNKYVPNPIEDQSGQDDNGQTRRDENEGGYNAESICSYSEKSNRLW
jgi:hypothetical protein